MAKRVFHTRCDLCGRIVCVQFSENEEPVNQPLVTLCTECMNKTCAMMNGKEIIPVLTPEKGKGK